MVTSQANDVVTFFLMVAVILAAARVCGECALKLKQPAIVGELLAGILLGPALLSSLPMDHPLWQPGRNSRALEGLLLISVILLLFVAGMEVEFSHLPRNGSRIALTSTMGFILPFLVGVIGAYWLPLGAHQASNPLFAFFFGTALTISSLPVIARILLDLGLLKNEVGGIIMMSAMVDDLIGWILLSVLLTLSTTDSLSVGHIVNVTVYTLGFAVFMLTIGRWVCDRLLPGIRRLLTKPHNMISLVLIVALGSAAATEAIGAHAVFGAFLAGLAVGDSKHLDRQSRDVIKLFVLNFFAPIYFATIGLKVNFVEHFDVQLTLTIVLLATVGKVIGSGLGAYWSGMPTREALAVGWGMNARGMMQIILATLAFQHGLIGESLLVSFVILAISTSLVSGPLLRHFLAPNASVIADRPTEGWGLSMPEPAVACEGDKLMRSVEVRS